MTTFAFLHSIIKLFDIYNVNNTTQVNETPNGK